MMCALPDQAQGQQQALGPLLRLAAPAAHSLGLCGPGCRAGGRTPSSHMAARQSMGQGKVLKRELCKTQELQEHNDWKFDRHNCNLYCLSCSFCEYLPQFTVHPLMQFLVLPTCNFPYCHSACSSGSSPTWAPAP